MSHREAAPPPVKTLTAAALALLNAVSPADVTALNRMERPFLAVAPAPLKHTKHTKRANRKGGKPSLLVNGCGRSGTHAVTALLRRNGIRAQHEGRGGEVTLGWPYVGHWAGDWHELWPMDFQPRPTDAHDPIFKVHRHPLMAISSIAAGLTSSGKCRNPSERRWDARAWRCATAFVHLPVAPALIDQQSTCDIDAYGRLKLALHYWVKWNLLGDRWATHVFAVENVTISDLAQHWCSHCERVMTCACPAAAQAIRANASSEQVRARRGHGHKKVTLSWSQLADVDHNMTMVAQSMTIAYGYNLTIS